MLANAVAQTAAMPCVALNQNAALWVGEFQFDPMTRTPLHKRETRPRYLEMDVRCYCNMDPTES